MNPFPHNWKIVPAALAAALILGGCSLVDEDLSDCDTTYKLDYELRLVTNMTTELETVLDMQSDLHTQAVLDDHLGDIFTDFAHDVDLSFYDVTPPMERLHHERHIMDANQSSYALSIPAREYRHIAVANILDNPQVTLENQEQCSTAEIRQQMTDGEPVPSHSTGIFSARLDMKVFDNTNQSFDTKLSMVNCASALVIDTSQAPELQEMEIVVADLASSFSISDSVYHFDASPLVLAKDLSVEGTPERCFSAVHFPSKDPEPTKVIIDTDEPFVSEDSENALWRIIVHVKLPDGSTTQSILGIHQPLRPGQLKVIRARVQDSGAVSADDPTVSVSVALDWSQGWNFDDVPLGK